MKRFLSFILVLTVACGYSSCKKSKLDPVATATGGDMLVGNWKLTLLTGQVDSAATLNGVTNTTKYSFAFDSVSNQSVQKINGVVKYQFPYSLVITLKNDGLNQITERYTRLNGANVLTPYLFVTNSSWNYTSTNNPYDGIVIRGFDKTSVLGDYKINPATTTNSNFIKGLLSAPVYNSYDFRNGHLYLYVHTQFIGNADSNTGGATTNPSIQINADYVLTFSKTDRVDSSNL